MATVVNNNQIVYIIGIGLKNYTTHGDNILCSLSAVLSCVRLYLPMCGACEGKDRKKNLLGQKINVCAYGRRDALCARVRKKGKRMKRTMYGQAERTLAERTRGSNRWLFRRISSYGATRDSVDP